MKRSINSVRHLHHRKRLLGGKLFKKTNTFYFRDAKL